MSNNYKVLANKYRPQNFDDLVGQDVLVRTLTNAIETDRIANAFVLTGIRGIGKTTTARIIAKALNCEKGGEKATAAPCGVCSNCVSITEDRHQDVLEMDAASRTGVDDIREIIDNCRYRPTSARYKIYIIDEVHMLSKNAFNALLKTLEEPPAHVKFIFATTEIRKIPVTVLSRCQRFDLKRLDEKELGQHLQTIAKNEGATIEEAASSMIATIAEGSARDAISLLDQAITISDKNVTQETIRNMVGGADHSQLLNLLETVFRGDTTAALVLLKDMYQSGIDMIYVTEELMQLTHLTTKTKITKELTGSAFLSQEDQNRLQEAATKLSLAYLTRCWQMLLKGLQEIKYAPDPLIAAEMVIIRLCHVSDLPDPKKLVEELVTTQSTTPAATTTAVPTAAAPQPQATIATAAAPDALAEPVASTNQQTLALTNFEEAVALFQQKGEVLLHSWLESEIRLIRFEPGRIECNISETVPSDVPGRIGSLLSEWTNQRWVVTVSSAAGEASIAEKQAQKAAAKLEDIKATPQVRSVLEKFSGADIITLQPRPKKDT